MSEQKSISAFDFFPLFMELSLELKKQQNEQKSKVMEQLREVYLLQPKQRFTEDFSLYQSLKTYYEEYKKKQKEKPKDDPNDEASPQDMINLLQETNSSQSESYPSKVSLPDLGIYPKDFPKVKTNKFLFRNIVLSYFQLLEEYDKKNQEETGSITYGFYFSGPNGVGKSVAVYFMACLARAMDWMVIYVPNCDQWVAKSSKPVQAYHFLFKEIARGITLHHDTPLSIPFTSNSAIKTIGDLVLYGLASNNEEDVAQVMSSIEDELENWKKCPLLLIFDEVNALFSNQANWDTKTAKDVGIFKIASSLDGLSLKRGWKVISGTGHEAFLLNIAPALEKCVHYFQPYTITEFNDLIASTEEKWLYTTLTSIKNKNVRERVDQLIKESFNCVPRQLYDFNRYFNEKLLRSSESGAKWSPEEYFTEKNIRNPQEQIAYALRQFIKYKKQFFLDSSTQYLHSLTESERLIHLSNLFSLFFPQAEDDQRTVSFPHQYTDYSMIYREGNQYRFLTPAVAHAIADLLSQRYSLQEDNDAKRILDPLLSSDEKSRPFERLFAKRLLLSPKTDLEIANLKNDDKEKITIFCKGSRPIPSTTWIPPFEYLSPTLLIPAEKDYPIADLILFDTESRLIIVFQLTKGEVKEKLPSKPPYSALFDQSKWNDLLQTNSKRKSIKVANNYIELLYYSYGQSNVKVRIDQSTRKLHFENHNSIRFLYIIVSPRELKPDASNFQQFPWVRVLTSENLRVIFGENILNALDDSRG